MKVTKFKLEREAAGKDEMVNLLKDTLKQIKRKRVVGIAVVELLADDTHRDWYAYDAEVLKGSLYRYVTGTALLMQRFLNMGRPRDDE